MDERVIELVAVDIPSDGPDDQARGYRRRVRTRTYALAGLAISGWLGFFVLGAFVLIVGPANMVEFQADKGVRHQPSHQTSSEASKEVREVKGVKAATPTPTPAQPQAGAPAPAPGPVVEQKRMVGPQPVTILTTYEERRRVQERVFQWDAADYVDGNVAAARLGYGYAARKGWAPAALALALTYDPHELQRRGVAIAADPAKARGCYLKARELMNAMVAYYISRLPQGTAEQC